MSKLDFIIRITKPRQRGRNVWISVCPLTFYTCGTAQTWEFLFLIGYACSDLPPIIYYHNLVIF